MSGFFWSGEEGVLVMLFAFPILGNAPKKL
jgi:hypothetical protein